MMALLARPWLRLPRLQAIYLMIAVGAPAAFFAVYELVALFRSFEILEEHSNAVVLTVLVIALLIVPHIYGHLTGRREIVNRANKAEFSYSPELATKFASSVITSFGIGLYLREQSAQAEIREQMLDALRLMIANAKNTTFSDEVLERLKAELEQPSDEIDLERHALLTKFLEKYQETHKV